MWTYSSTDLDIRSQPVSRQVAAEITSMLAVLVLPQQSNLHMKSRRCSRPATYGQLAWLLCKDIMAAFKAQCTPGAVEDKHR